MDDAMDEATKFADRLLDSPGLSLWKMSTSLRKRKLMSVAMASFGTTISTFLAMSFGKTASTLRRLLTDSWRFPMQVSFGA